MTDGGLVIDRASLPGLRHLRRACPANALELLGTDASTVDELSDEVLKDRAYFETSGGGVTALGRRAAACSPVFWPPVWRGCTRPASPPPWTPAGWPRASTLEKVLPHADLVLFDLKRSTRNGIERLTGQSNGRILDTLRLVRDILAGPEARVSGSGRPLIPRATAPPENLAASAPSWPRTWTAGASAGNCAPSTTCAATSTGGWGWNGPLMTRPLMQTEEVWPSWRDRRPAARASIPTLWSLPAHRASKEWSIDERH